LYFKSLPRLKILLISNLAFKITFVRFLLKTSLKKIQGFV